MNHFAVATLALTTLLATQASSVAQQNPTRDPYETLTVGDLPAELPLALAGTQILVDGVFVNGKGPYRFLLDTGGQGAGRVDRSLVEALGLEKVGEIQAGDGSGRQGPIMPVHHLESLTLGPLRFEGVRVLSRDYNRFGADARGHIDGVLGFGLFQELLLTLDYPGRRMLLERGALPEPDGREVLAFETGRGAPAVEVRLADRTHVAVVDTGNMGGVTISEAVAGELPLSGEPVEVGQARTVSGPFAIQSAPLDGSLRIGAHAVEEPELTIAGPMPGVNLGGGALRDFALTFDQTNRRMRIVRPPSAIPDGAAARSQLRGGASRTPMRLVNGRPAVGVTVGAEEASFVLDTGAGVTVLSPAIIERLGLEATGKTRIGDPANPTSTEVNTYTIPEVTVGGARFFEVPAVDLQSPMIWTGLGDVEGILAFPLFHELLLTLDFPGEEIVLRRGALGANDSSVSFRLDDWVPTLDLSFGEHRVDAHIDTGNSRTITLPASIEDKLRFTQPPTVVGKGRSVSGEFEVRGGTLDQTLALAGKEFSDLSVTLNDRYAWANVGTALLQDFAVTWDQTNRRVLLEGERSSQARAKPKRYGIMVGRTDDGGIQVRGTEAGGPAEMAGLREGDKILRLNGQVVSSLEPTQLGELFRASPLTLLVERDGAELEIEMSLQE